MLEVFQKRAEVEISSLRDRLRIAEAEIAQLGGSVLDRFGLEVQEVETRIEELWSHRVKELTKHFELEKEDLA